MDEERVRVEEYAHSAAHHAVVVGDLGRLARVLAGLPRLAHPSQVRTTADAARQERLVDAVAAVVDRRDGIPGRDTPLHLAVRLRRPLAFVDALASAGADPSLHNSAGWSPLHLALCLRRRGRRQRRSPEDDVVVLLLRHHRFATWAKFRRRLPLLLAAFRRLPDFYLELGFHFESPLLPSFLPSSLRSALPSDTYRIWKRGDDLRADTTLAGFEGLRVRRSPRSFLFLGSGGDAAGVEVPMGSLLILHRKRKEVWDAFEGADDVRTPSADEDDVVADASAYRPGIDVTKAELVARTTWRRKEKTEMVCEWKARVYDIHNVVFSFKTMRAADNDEVSDGDEDDEIVPLELHDDNEEGFLVADIPAMPARHSCYESGARFGHRRKDLELVPGESERRRKSVDAPASTKEEDKWVKLGKARDVKSKEKETVKSLRPAVWLTEDFPLKLEELMPLLDILANKVKAVRRLRELLATKFPSGTFPVKVTLPILPAVRVVVTFNKFVYLQQTEQFFTPLSSPSLFSSTEDDEDQKAENPKNSLLRWNTSTPRSKSVSPQVDDIDPFLIPPDYTWISINSKNQKIKKSKSKKGKLARGVTDKGLGC